MYTNRYTCVRLHTIYIIYTYIYISIYIYTYTDCIHVYPNTTPLDSMCVCINTN